MTFYTTGGPGRRARLALPVTLMLAAAGVAGGDTAKAKTPGETYCFNGTCHRVKSIAETEALVGAEETLSASFYDTCENDPLNPCGLTSSGEVFRADAPDNAASPIYPDGTMLLVWSPQTREAAVLRVNNAGPYWGERKLDVSRATAERLGFAAQGVTQLQVRVLDAPEADEATYNARRTYAPVPGYIGQFDSFDAAHSAMAAMMGLEAIAPSLLAPLSGSAVASQHAESAPEPLSAPAPAVIAWAPQSTDPKPAILVSKTKTRKAVTAAAPKTRGAAQVRSERKRVAAKTRKAPRAKVAAVRKPTRTADRRKRPAVASARPARRDDPERHTGAPPPNDTISVFSRYRVPEPRAASSRRASGGET